MKSLEHSSISSGPVIGPPPESAGYHVKSHTLDAVLIRGGEGNEKKKGKEEKRGKVN